jgi:hypothetical protein
VGGFIFPTVAPGTYYLSMNTARAEGNWVPFHPMPMELTVVGGKDRVLDLPLTHGAAVSGRVIAYKAAPTGGGNVFGEKDQHFIIGENGAQNGSLQTEETGLVEDHGLSNILVELTNGSFNRRFTDRKGYFTFDQLTPGTYTLKVHSNNLPSYHYLAAETFEFELLPGEEKEIEIKVLPKKRKIHIIDEGDTLVEEEKKEPAGETRLR